MPVDNHESKLKVYKFITTKSYYADVVLPEGDSLPEQQIFELAKRTILAEIAKQPEPSPDGIRLVHVGEVPIQN